MLWGPRSRRHPRCTKGYNNFVLIQPSTEGGGGLRKYGICLLIFEKGCFLMPSFDRRGARKGYV